MNALKDEKSVFIDRCNVEKEQRDDFVKLGGSSQVDVHAVVLDLPAKLCILRYVKRKGHEGKVEGGKAVAIVNRMLQKKELPKLSEGFARITCCQSESDVQSSVDAYSGLGPLDTLPNGAKIQLGLTMEASLRAFCLFPEHQRFQTRNFQCITQVYDLIDSNSL
ncbi:hypothetical protein ACFX2J_009854 [Malus domestica]